MHCDTSSKPRIDLSMAKHPRAIHVAVLRFVRGLRGSRKTPVNRKAIGAWLAFTPATAVDMALSDLVAEGKISAGYNSLRHGNTARRAIVYEFIDRPAQCDDCPTLAECTAHGCKRKGG